MKGETAMKITFKRILDYLEKPENEDQIKHLANLKNFKHLEKLKQISGCGDIFVRGILGLTKNKINAFMVLSECKKTVDIVEFKKTKHFKKIRNCKTGYAPEWLGLFEKL